MNATMFTEDVAFPLATPELLPEEKMGPDKTFRHDFCRFITLLLAVVLMSAACNKTTKEGGPGKRHKVAFVTNNTSDYWTIARKGTEKAVAEVPNVDVDFRIDPDNSAAEQQRIVDDLLSKGIEGIAISPVDPVNQTPMLNKAAAQTLVITQDSDAPNSK